MADSDWISTNNAHHYVIDGVPMKVNNCFRLKAFEDSLPPNLRINIRQSTVLNTPAYSFETEDGYIQWYNEYLEEKQQRELERQKRKEEAQKAAAEAKEKSAEALRKTTANNKESSTNKMGPPKQSTLSETKQPTVSSSILQPQRASPITVSSQAANHHVYENVVKDFENTGEDPFNNMELNTINDLKELETVLASSSAASEEMAKASKKSEEVTEAKMSEKSGENISEEINTSNEIKLRPHNDIYENVSTVLNGHSSRANGDSSRALPPRPESLPHIRKPLPAPRKPSSVPTSPSESSPTEETLSISIDTKNKGVVSFTASNDGVTHSSKDDAIKRKPAVKPKPTGVSKISALSSMLENDLSKASQHGKTANKGFSYVKPAATNNNDNVKNIEWPSFDSTESPSPKPNAELNVPPQTNNPFSKLVGNNSNPPETVNPPNNTTSSVPELAVDKEQNATKYNRPAPGRPAPGRPAPGRPPLPKNKLKGVTTNTSVPTPISTEDQVTNSLLSMGFERVHINAAIRNLGCDTKKLVEHLISLQKLTANNIKWQYAQEALFEFNSDNEQAEKYAKEYQKLVEFGFDKEKIKSALLTNNMDFEKSLNELI